MLEIIEELPIKTEGEINYLELPIKDFDSVMDLSVVRPSKEELIRLDPYTFENAPDSVFENHYELLRNYERTALLCMAVKQLGVDLYHGGSQINADFIDDNHIKLYKGNTKEHDFITVELRFDNSISENDVKEAGQINNALKSEYMQYGLTALNGIYHYGTIEDTIYNSSLVLYRFPEFKNQLEDYPGYEVITLTEGAGGIPLEFGTAVMVGIVKNDKLLSIKRSHFSINTLLVVDEEIEGNIYDKATVRLNEYFGEDNFTLTILDNGNNINVEDDYYTDTINNLLGTAKERYDIYKGLIEFKNGNSQEFYIINVPTETVDKYSVISKDKSTGVMISTGSYDVSIDTFVNAEDVKDEEFVKKSATQNNIKYDYVYNIDLVRKTDGAFIKTITNGVEVYIPVENKTIGDILSVYYIKEDSTIGEELQGEVVKIDNKLYVKFITDHFSVYAIGNKVEASKDIENPQTYDGILNWILLGVISISGIAGTLVYKKKINIY